jgi:hypothetical protein
LEEADALTVTLSEVWGIGQTPLSICLGKRISAIEGLQTQTALPSLARKSFELLNQFAGLL